MLDTRRIMKLFGLGGSPTTPQSASGGRKQRPVTQYSTSPSSNVYLTPPSSGATGADDADADYPPLTAPVAPIGASIAPFKASKTPPVLFYEKNAPFYEFTNFSPHDIMYKGKRYPTSEHLFQSFKFLDDHPEIAERIRKCGERPMMAFDEAHRYQNWVRTDWRQVNVEKMEAALHLKFTQHLDLKAMLLGTGDAELIEDSPRDYFWGVGADNTGRNELGKALVRLRAELRQEQDDPSHIPTARRDTNRFSVQDLTSLIPTQPTSLNLNRFSVAFTSAPGGARSGTTSHVGSPTATGLCEFCKMRPKFQNHQYCGRTCATEAGRMCGFCRSKPRYGKHPYCSRSCAAKASGAV